MGETVVHVVSGIPEWLNFITPIAAIVTIIVSLYISNRSMKESRSLLRENLLHDEKMRSIAERHTVYNEVIVGILDAVYNRYQDADSFRAAYAALDAKMQIYASEEVYCKMAVLRNAALEYVKMLNDVRKDGREWDNLFLNEQKIDHRFNDAILAFTKKITDDIANDRNPAKSDHSDTRMEYVHRS